MTRNHPKRPSPGLLLLLTGAVVAFVAIAPATAQAAVNAVTFSPLNVRGGLPATGTVTLVAAAPPGGALVTLSSSNPAASVPADVTVAAGLTSATFGVTTTPVNATVSPIITATDTTDGISKTKTIGVLPPGVSSFSVNPSSVYGGNSTTGTVTLAAAAAAGGQSVTISIVSPITGPASVTVPAGATSLSFPITTQTVTSTFIPNFTASTSGGGSQTSLTVKPRGTITGTVRGLPSNAVLAGATVSAPNGDSTTTNASGVYTLYTTPSPSVTISFSMATYVTATSTVNLPTNGTVTANKTLSPFGSLSGTVKDSSTGNPISGATVQALPPQTYTATTDAAGNFSITGIDQSATLRLQFSKAGYITQLKQNVSVGPGINQTVGIINLVSGSGTEVGGAITQNTTWTVSGGPYFVVSSLTISSGITLTIDPGVTVKFNKNMSLNGGRLLAVGTAASPITLTSNAAVPAVRDWGPLTSPGTTVSPSRISYATISYAGAGSAATTITMANGNLPNLDHVTFINTSDLGITNATGVDIHSCVVTPPTTVSGTPPLRFPGNPNSKYAYGNLTLNYWGASTGPAGTPPVIYSPWLTAPQTEVQYFVSATALNTTFNPQLGIQATFNFTTSLSGNWTATVVNGSGATVRTLAGTGSSASVLWDGLDGSGVAQPNGVYTIRVDSVTPGGDAAAPAMAKFTLDTTKTFTVTGYSLTPVDISPNGDGVQDSAFINGTIPFDGVTWSVTVRNAGGTLVRSASYVSGDLGWAWDGKNDSNVVVPDGVYTLSLTGTLGANTVTFGGTVTVDTVRPVVSITFPTANQVISNLYTGLGPLEITGSVSDANLLNYWFTSSPTGTIVGAGNDHLTGVIGYWYIMDTTVAFPFPNGTYQAGLTAKDKAGNTSSTVGVTVSLKNVRVTSLNGVAPSLNKTTGGVVSIQTIVPFSLTETLSMRNEAGQLVREWSAARAAGTYTDTWNGKDDAGQWVPDGAYPTTVTASDGTHSLSFPIGGAVGSAYPPVPLSGGLTVTPGTFDPFANKPMSMQFQLTYPTKVWLILGQEGIPGCASPNACPVNAEYLPPGPISVQWSGLDSQGAYVWTPLMDRGGVSVQYPVGVGVYSSRSAIANVAATPPLYFPGAGSAAIAFDLQSTQVPSMTGVIKIVSQQNLQVLRTIPVTAAPGARTSVNWDGRSDSGQYVVAGSYSILISLTDSVGTPVKGQGIVTVGY